MTQHEHRRTILTPSQMFTLDNACRSIHEAFGETPYLVGSAAEAKRDARDVDVRLVLPDALFTAVNVQVWALFGLITSAHLSHITSLNIDFQIQAQTQADEFDGKRNPLGTRHLLSYPPRALAEALMGEDNQR